MNNFRETGRLTKDGEYSVTPSNVNVYKNTLAYETQKDKTTFLNMVVFGKLADTCKTYWKKGHLVEVSGTIEIESVEKDGYVKSYTKLIVNDIKLLPNEKKEESKMPTPTKEDGTYKDSFKDNNLPF